MSSVRDHRLRRHRRIRKKIAGSTDRPRLAVFRSNRHLYAQLIDDLEGKTIVSASTLEAEMRGQSEGNGTAVAEQVGKLVAQRAIEKGVKSVVFDRGGFRFHGKVKALADAARQQGLEF